MVLWSIAYKNIKAVFKNVFMIIFLIAVPLFQIALMSMVSNNVSSLAANASTEGFVEVITLHTSENSALVQDFSSGILVQFILLTGVIAASMIVTEREENTLVRLFAAPISKLKMLCGILLGHAITVLIVTACIIGLSSLFLEVNWGNSLFNLAVVTTAAIYVSTSLGFIVSGVFKTSKLAGGVMSIVIILMTFGSGAFLPEAQVEAVAKFTINKWISDSYMSLMEGYGLKSIYGNLLILTVMGTVFMFIASVIYRRESIYE